MGVYEHLDEYMEAGTRLRNVLEGRHPPLKEKFGQKVTSSIEQKIRKQCKSLKYFSKVSSPANFSEMITIVDENRTLVSCRY